MSYRSDKTGQLEWMRFKERYRARLVAVGIPDAAFGSQGEWYYFVEHVYLAEQPELLNLEHWSDDGLENLLPVFQEMDADGFYAGEIIRWIQGRMKKEAEQGEEPDAGNAPQ